MPHKLILPTLFNHPFSWTVSQISRYAQCSILSKALDVEQSSQQRLKKPYEMIASWFP